MEGLVTHSFWRGRNVFVTGHTGFKGSWLCLWLRQMGATVTGYALPPATQPNSYDLFGLNDDMTSIVGDVRDRAALQAALQTAMPEIVIHMAAQALVRPSYDDPVGTFATNVMGSVNLLDAVREMKSVRAVVILTSDKCYENHERLEGYREDEAMGGYDPYSSSKGCAELVTAAYRRSFFADGPWIASARAGNVIGGGDWSSDRIVPDIMRAIVAGETVSLRNPGAIRPWQHVLEPLGGYLVLAQRLVEQGAAFAEAWNFGPDDADSVKVSALVEKLLALWGEGARWALHPNAASQPYEAHYLKLDCTKAATRLGWHPRWTLDETLASIVAFGKAWRAGDNVKQTALAQIEEYSCPT